MLGTLLDRLSAFFSRAFLVNCIPLLFFLFLHGLTAYFASAAFQSWVRTRLLSELEHPALLSFAVILAVSIVAYVLSTLTLPSGSYPDCDDTHRCSQFQHAHHFTALH